MELLNELLEKQIEQLNYNRSELITAISEADELSSNYGGKIEELRSQIASIDERIDYLMGKIVSVHKVDTENGGSIRVQGDKFDGTAPMRFKSKIKG